MLQLSFPMPSLRTRLLLSLAAGFLAGFFCWFLMVRLHQGAGDFAWAIRMAQDLLAKGNPYARPLQLYPLPAAIFGLPLVNLKPELAAGIFYGISSALLAFGLTRYGCSRLLIFLAYPYWAGLLAVQWLPLIMASAFFRPLQAVTLAKPQIGLPVMLAHLDRKGVIACLTLATLSFIVMPHWFPLWFAQLGAYARFIPILIFPGPLLALSLFRYRNRDAWLLFIGSCMPQRWFYDPFFLWLIPKKRREIVYTVGISWIAGIWRWCHAPHSFTEVGRWSVLCLYLPMLVVVLLRKTTPDSPPAPSAPVQISSDGHSAS